MNTCIIKNIRDNSNFMRKINSQCLNCIACKPEEVDINNIEPTFIHFFDTVSDAEDAGWEVYVSQTGVVYCTCPEHSKGGD